MSFDWYTRDSGQWLKLKQVLDLDEKGALDELTDLTHNRNAWFVDDDKRVAGALGISPRRWRPIRERLIEVGAITIDEGYVVIPLLVRALSESEARSNRARTIGQRGGLASAKARKVNGLDEPHA